MASQISCVAKPDRHRQRKSLPRPQQLALPLEYSPRLSGCPQSSERELQMLGETKSGQAGPIYPGGRLGLRDEYGGAMWRRIVDEGVRFGRVNPQLGSEVGRLLFHGQITEVEAAAASQIAEIYGRYERSQALRRTVASPSYVNEIDNFDFEEESLDDVLRVRRAKRHFHKLQIAIPTPRARAVLEQLCVDDQPIGPIDLMDARKLLRRLAVMSKSTLNDAFELTTSFSTTRAIAICSLTHRAWIA